MARKPRRKTGGRDFQPGQSGNPAGRPPLPPDIKAARELTRVEFERLLNKYLFCTEEELEAARAQHDLPALEKIIVRIVELAVSGGDTLRLNFLLERLIPQPKEPPNPTVFNFMTMSRTEILALGEQAVKVLKAAEKQKGQA